MYKIDLALKGLSDDIDALSKRGTIAQINAEYSDVGYFTATSETITDYTNGMVISLSLNQTNQGTVGLNINEIGTVQIVYATPEGTLQDITSGMMKQNSIYFCVYNGTYWVLSSAGYASTSNNVSDTINGKNITDIFETDGTTVKLATLQEDVNKEWSEIDEITPPEPEAPREADQLNGYTAQQIIDEATTQVTVTDIVYSVGDTISTSDASFDPNTLIGGTWIKGKTYVKFSNIEQIQLENGATADVSNYYIRNGLCFITLGNLNVSSGGIIASSVPAALTTFYFYAGPNSQNILYVTSSGVLYANDALSNVRLTFQYPITEINQQLIYTWTKTA